MLRTIHNRILIHRTSLAVCALLVAAGTLWEGYSQWVFIQDMWSQVLALPIYPSRDEMASIFTDEVVALAPISTMKVIASYISIGFAPLFALLLLGINIAAHDYDVRMDPFAASFRGRSFYYIERLEFAILCTLLLITGMTCLSLAIRLLGFSSLDPRLQTLASPGSLFPIFFEFFGAVLVGILIMLLGFTSAIVFRNSYTASLGVGAFVGLELVVASNVLPATQFLPIGVRWSFVKRYFHLDGGVFDPPSVVSSFSWMPIVVAMSLIAILLTLSACTAIRRGSS